MNISYLAKGETPKYSMAEYMRIPAAAFLTKFTISRISENGRKCKFFYQIKNIYLCVIYENVSI